MKDAGTGRAQGKSEFPDRRGKEEFTEDFKGIAAKGVFVCPRLNRFSEANREGLEQIAEIISTAVQLSLEIGTEAK